MIGTKILKNRILIVLSLVAVMVFGGAGSLYAEDNVSVPDLTKDSRLVVVTQYTDEKEITPISGMELTIYKVAELTVDNGKINYKPTSEFEAAGIDFNNLTTSSSIEAAAELYKLIESGEIEGRTAVSEASGQTLFGTVDKGMYLVVQTGATGDAKEYTKLDPYIIMTPQPATETEIDSWEYNVYSIPKMQVAYKTVKLTKKVNDKDSIVQDPSNKFSYTITADISYAPDQFAVVDNVPEELQVIDKKRIQVEVNGKRLSEDVKNAILSIDGNKVKVEPTEEQIAKWAPFEMKILFYCQFKQDLVFTEENQTVVNTAGYEVNSEYVEPEGGDNEATVKAEMSEPTNVGDKDSARTGDEFAKYMTILILAMCLSVLIILVVVFKRRRNAKE